MIDHEHVRYEQNHQTMSIHICTFNEEFLHCMYMSKPAINSETLFRYFSTKNYEFLKRKTNLMRFLSRNKTIFGNF